MTYPNLHIAKGPGGRDLEQAFLARNLGASAKFSLITYKDGLIEVQLRIFNFNFITCQGQNYKIGGQLVGLSPTNKEKLPPFNWIFAEYNAEERSGTMTFSNAG